MDPSEEFDAADNLSGHPAVPPPNPDWRDTLAAGVLLAAVLAALGLIGYGIATTPWVRG